MTFQHGGHGCAGIAGVLGAFGVHLPDKPHNLPHLSPPPHHDFGGQFGQHVRDSISHFSGGGGGMTGGKPDPGESVGMFGGQPLDLVFGNPAPAAGEHAFSLAAIPVGGGVTMSIVALIAVACMVLIMASMTVRTVAVRTAGTKCSR